MKKFSFIVIGGSFLLTGCAGLRFGPTEIQKQNAWLHNRTAQLTADTARVENVSPSLKKLTVLGEMQSRVFTSDYGLPKQYPPAGGVEEILIDSNFQLARDSLWQAVERPDLWQLTDGVIDLGIGIMSLLGGVYGMKLADFLKQARAKSKALKEIVEGNEIFKHRNSGFSEAFKDAQRGQSSETRQVVAQMKM